MKINSKKIRMMGFTLIILSLFMMQSVLALSGTDITQGKADRRRPSGYIEDDMTLPDSTKFYKNSAYQVTRTNFYTTIFTGTDKSHPSDLQIYIWVLWREDSNNALVFLEVSADPYEDGDSATWDDADFDDLWVEAKIPSSLDHKMTIEGYFPSSGVPGGTHSVGVQFGGEFDFSDDGGAGISAGIGYSYSWSSKIDTLVSTTPNYDYQNGGKSRVATHWEYSGDAPNAITYSFKTGYYIQTTADYIKLELDFLSDFSHASGNGEPQGSITVLSYSKDYSSCFVFNGRIYC